MKPTSHKPATISQALLEVLTNETASQDLLHDFLESLWERLTHPPRWAACALVLVPATVSCGSDPNAGGAEPLRPSALQAVLADGREIVLSPAPKTKEEESGSDQKDYRSKTDHHKSPVSASNNETPTR